MMMVMMIIKVDDDDDDGDGDNDGERLWWWLLSSDESYISQRSDVLWRFACGDVCEYWQETKTKTFHISQNYF